ncbi:hypothetical protein CONPUDRAFT_75252 [Coniophora puteana RWD-64-598 SS2]|uniref:Uncharacterized protein n=1 Tax=Coniophora puteana (strain RWD-64-598) TaxID=741705 RepID=A0A5M3MI75_CONPW|nr:uncharacterized protein CONPUDRAFT_75252 [Coniophora puteana RWD-64-598 SS2]EIW78630.1 hypothetical protein CONPUDRAFT_75252 [Coniophora puteana RWD-64-598 SS2]
MAALQQVLNLVPLCYDLPCLHDLATHAASSCRKLVPNGLSRYFEMVDDLSTAIIRLTEYKALLTNLIMITQGLLHPCRTSLTETLATIISQAATPFLYDQSHSTIHYAYGSYAGTITKRTRIAGELERAPRGRAAACGWVRIGGEGHRRLERRSRIEDGPVVGSLRGVMRLRGSCVGTRVPTVEICGRMNQSDDQKSGRRQSRQEKGWLRDTEKRRETQDRGRARMCKEDKER